MKIVWSEAAEGDLDEQVRFIAQDNLDAALRIEDRIIERVAALAENPRMGRVGRVAGTRELVIAHTSFLAVYELAEGVVTILRILHGAQRWPPKA